MSPRVLRPHPAREEILAVLRHHDAPISPPQLARITGATLGSTAYHVRALMTAGIVELADEVRGVRSTIEHFYTLVAEADDGEPAGDAVRRLLSLCGALTVPDPGGGYPLSSEVDDDAAAALEAILETLRPQVRRIVAASTTRVRRKRG